MSDEKDDTAVGDAGWIVRPPSFRGQELSILCRGLREELEGNPNYVATHRKGLRIESTSKRLVLTQSHIILSHQHMT